jgi:nucleoside permease NupC
MTEQPRGAYGRGLTIACALFALAMLSLAVGAQGLGVESETVRVAAAVAGGLTLVGVALVILAPRVFARLDAAPNVSGSLQSNLDRAGVDNFEFRGPSWPRFAMICVALTAIVIGFISVVDASNLVVAIVGGLAALAAALLGYVFSRSKER